VKLEIEFKKLCGVGKGSNHGKNESKDQLDDKVPPYDPEE